MKTTKIMMVVAVALVASAAIPANLANTVEGASSSTNMPVPVPVPVPMQSNCEGWASCEGKELAQQISQEQDLSARACLAPIPVASGQSPPSGGYGWSAPQNANEVTGWFMIQPDTTLYVNSCGKPFWVCYESMRNTEVADHCNHVYEFRQNVLTGRWVWDQGYGASNQRFQFRADWDNTTFYTTTVVYTQNTHPCGPGCG